MIIDWDAEARRARAAPAVVKEIARAFAERYNECAPCEPMDEEDRALICALLDAYLAGKSEGR